MLALLLRRLIQMALIMAVASLILFVIFDTEEFKKKIAVAELGGFAVSALTEEAYQNWLAEKGLDAPFYERFVNWVGDVVTGEFGHSFEKNTAIGPLLLDRLINTGILAFWVFALMIPLSLVLGVLAGMKEGSGAGPRHLVHLGVHHLDPGDRHRDHPHRGVRPRARLAAGEIGDDPGVGLEAAGPAGADAGALRLRLRRAHDPGVDGRGHDLAIHPHRGPEGHPLPARDHEARACATP